MSLNYLTPAEIAEANSQTSVKRASLTVAQMLILGMMAGAYIAFAAEGSNMAAFNLLSRPETYGLGRALAGIVFPTGLMLVVVAGGELFTGNTLMLGGVLAGRISLGAMLRNWGWVYLGNLLGALLVVYLMVHSGLFSSGGNLLGGMTIKLAAAKTQLSFEQAFFLGILRNWLVCLAVWMAYAAKDLVSKLLACYFPIWLFITSGFEHSVANMYYIPAGLLAKGNPAWAAASGLSAEQPHLAELFRQQPAAGDAGQYREWGAVRSSRLLVRIPESGSADPTGVAAAYQPARA